jgi:hypothetical protein
MNPQISGEREKVMLGDKEYIRDLVILQDSGETGHLYQYARKLDENLMCCISIGIWSDKSPEEYEKLFE